MIWRILGPVEVVWQGRALEIKRPQHRAVLAYLLLNAGHVVGVDQLVEAIWAQAAPAGAHRQVRVRVSQLRAVLRPAGLAGALASAAGGYLLSVAAGEFDAAAFTARLDRARAASAGGRRAEAAGHLRAGLQLWRGPALAGAAGSFVDVAALRLQEQWLTAHEQLADAELALGRYDAVVETLRPIVDAHPLRERLVGQLMLGLAGCGRQADALSLFGHIRAELAEQLGVEPAAELSAAHLRVLRHQLSESAPPAPSATASSARSTTPTAPAGLPSDRAGFVGREAELAELDALAARLIPADRASGPAHPALIAAIDGTAGVGKTALAVHWAHRIRHLFPDGQLYVDLRGFDPTGRVVPPAEALRWFLAALDVPPERMPDGQTERSTLLRSLLAGRRLLMVLDNARDADQVRPLVPGSPGCFTVVTSRNQLTGLVAIDGAHPIGLDLLTVAEARQLLAHRLAADRMAADPVAVDEIIGRCARLPLALAIVSARAAAHPTFPLAGLVAEIRQADPRLDVFDSGDDPAADVRAVLSWSYRTLDDASARLFRLLSLHPGPDVTAPAVASLDGSPPAQVRAPLARLIHAHLISEHQPGRYRRHELLQAYAHELCQSIDPPAERRSARRRLVDHYLHTAHAVDKLLHPHRGDPATPAPAASGVVLADVDDRARAEGWLAAEYEVLLAVIHQAACTGFERQSFELAQSIKIFLDYRGCWRELASVYAIALQAAQRVADRPSQARAHRGLAQAYSRLGSLDRAHEHFGAALRQYAELGDDICLAHTHIGWALTYLLDDRITESLEQARRALDLYRRLDDRVGQADALNNIGWCLTVLGQHEEALVRCQQAVDLHCDIGDQHGQANAWDSLGHAHHQAGHHSQAVHCYQSALALFGELGDRRHQAQTLDHLGEVYRDAGQIEAARSAWRQALAILDRLGHPDADVVRDRLAALPTAVAAR